MPLGLKRPLIPPVLVGHHANHALPPDRAQGRHLLHRKDRMACARAAVGQREQPARRLRGQDAPAAEGQTGRLQAREMALFPPRRSNQRPVY